MHGVKIDEEHHIIEFFLDGSIDEAEMKAFIPKLEEATLSQKGHDIMIRADVRGFLPASESVAEMIRAVQEFGIKSGVKRVAEVVESQMVALQLNRVARESGTDKILRRFWDEESAREWLIHGDPE